MPGVLRLLDLRRVSPRMSILPQLRLEEALFRSSTDSFLLLNHVPTSSKSIVVGLSTKSAPGKLEGLVELEHAQRSGTPVIKRFTGGGTVLVDGETLFVSFLGNSRGLPEPFQPFPKSLMQWSARFYDRAFSRWREQLEISDEQQKLQFWLQENDYCVDGLKFAGNAQSISGGRFIHHSSILWNTDMEEMERLLKIPKRELQPEYRKGRGHRDFVRVLSDFVDDKKSSPDEFLDVFKHAVMEDFCGSGREFTALEELSELDIHKLILDLESKAIRITTELLDLSHFTS